MSLCFLPVHFPVVRAFDSLSVRREAHCLAPKPPSGAAEPTDEQRPRHDTTRSHKPMAPDDTSPEREPDDGESSGEHESAATEAEEMPYIRDPTAHAVGRATLPDQIRCAVFNRHCYLDDIAEYTTFSYDWTSEIVEDMVYDDDLREFVDDDGRSFYMLPVGERPRLDESVLNDAHDRALTERVTDGVVGDEKDREALLAELAADSEDAADDSEDAADDSEDAADDSEDAADADDDSPAPPPVASMDISTPADTGDETDTDEVIVSTAASKAVDAKGVLPVDRAYDWEQQKLHPSEVTEYISTDGELEDIISEIESRRETGKLPHFRICGPHGCGKTTLPENIAVQMDAPVFEIQCHDGLRPNNIIGMPTYVGDETWWSDGPGPKALLASQERAVVVILDEVNRAPSRSLGVFMSMLDHRCEITIPARGGETIKGNPMNLLVFSTMNEGDGYIVNKLDRAQTRRFGNTFYTDYIGMHDPEVEADLLVERTPINKKLAMLMVKAANDVRKKASGDSAVSMGITTSMMLDWARTVWTYRNDDYDGGPVMKAARRAVLNPFFTGDSQEEDIVFTTLESHLAGIDVHEDTDESTADEDTEADVAEESVGVTDETWLICESCGWYEETEDADAETTTTMLCPKCSSTILPKESL